MIKKTCSLSEKTYEKPLYQAQETRLHQCLQGITPENSIVFCDMSNTILYKFMENGFSLANRNYITNYAQRGGTFVLVTGDSAEFIDKEFVKPLDYQHNNPVYMMPGAGYRIDSLSARQLRTLYTGYRINYSARMALLDRALTILYTYAPQAMPDEKQIISLRSRPGSSVELSDKGLPLFIESKPDKVTLSALNIKTQDETVTNIVVGFGNDPITQVILQEEIAYNQSDKTWKQLHASKCSNYCEYIAMDKAEGISVFYKHMLHMIPDLHKKHVMAIGDGENDLCMLTYRFPTLGSVLGFYGGKDDDFGQRLDKMTDRHGFYLKNEYTNVPGWVLNNLIKQ